MLNKTRTRNDYDKDPRWAYLEWLRMEARLLQREIEPQLGDGKFIPDGTFAGHFHIPANGNWRDVPPPSTRAELVLRAVGVKFPEVAA